jgi:hypothetical protein
MDRWGRRELEMIDMACGRSNVFRELRLTIHDQLAADPFTAIRGQYEILEKHHL